MQYTRVYMDAMGYELPAQVVSSDELEERLSPVYDTLHLPKGQLAALTGIHERRWWEPDYPLSLGAAAAAKKALARTNVEPEDLEVLIYAGVCREHFEPATACAVANELNLAETAQVYDITNACLGVLNGIIDIANRIELKQIRAGMVVSCESSRDIMELTIEQLNADPTMAAYGEGLATLTGGSGAAAILLTDGSFSPERRRRLLGGVTRSATEHHRLCRWGVTKTPQDLAKMIFQPDRLQSALNDLFDPGNIPAALREIMQSDRLPATITKMLPSERLPKALTQFMTTDSVGVLKHGVELGIKTWGAFLKNMGWGIENVDRVISHQVGEGHRSTVLQALGISPDKDFSTFRHLGNIGTVSVPITAAMAEQRRFLKQGDRVGFLGIGSGLNCLMLGWDW